MVGAPGQERRGPIRATNRGQLVRGQDRHHRLLSAARPRPATRAARAAAQLGARNLGPAASVGADPVVRVAVGDHQVEGLDARFLVRIPAGDPAARARTGLLELDDVVVLPVGQVPEVTSAGDVQVGPADRIAVEVQVAVDDRPVRAGRPGLVGQDVVGVDADDQVRPQDVVVDPALVDVVGRIEERPAVAQAVHRHRLAAFGEDHPAALPGAVREEVAAQVVRGQLVQERVDARAVVALGVVLGHDLPVGSHVIGQPGGPAQPR